jgi:hypothetical protein
MAVAIVAVLALVVFFGMQMVLRRWDEARIHAAAAAKGWRNVEVWPEPLAPGWLGNRNERQYLVVHETDAGEGRAYCKTSLLTGVYWRDDMESSSSG